MNKKNILVITSPFMPTHVGGTCFGGIETYCSTLISTHHNNHNFTVILTDDGSCAFDNVTVIKSNSNSKELEGKLTGNPKCRFNYGSYCKAIGSLDLNSFDLIVNNSDKLTINNFLYQVAKKNNVRNKIVTYFHNPPIWRGSEKDCSRFLEMKEFITFVGISKLTAKMWNDISQRLKGENLCKGYNENYVSDTLEEYRTPVEVNLYNWAAVGRITDQKNPMLFNKFTNSLNSRISVLGEGKPEFTYNFFCHRQDEKLWENTMKTKSINAYYREDIALTDKLNYIYSNKCLGVSTSTWETFGITACEFFSMGLPIICADSWMNYITWHVKRNDLDFYLETDDFIINSVGILIKGKAIKKPELLGEAIWNALEIARSKHVFNGKYIRDYFINNYHINGAIDTFINILTPPRPSESL